MRSTAKHQCPQLILGFTLKWTPRAGTDCDEALECVQEVFYEAHIEARFFKGQVTSLMTSEASPVQEVVRVFAMIYERIENELEPCKFSVHVGVLLICP